MDLRSPLRTAAALALIGLTAGFAPVQARAPTATATAAQTRVRVQGHGIEIQLGANRIELQLVRANTLHVHFEPGGKTTPPSLVIAPDAPKTAGVPVTVTRNGDRITLASDAMRVDLDTRTLALSVYAAGGTKPLLQQADLSALAHGALSLQHASGAPLYGINGFNAFDKDSAGLLRHGTEVASAGDQGNVGAPLVWSTDGFGVLVDTKGATFDLGDGRIGVGKTSRPDLSYYLMVGSPKAVLGAVADISGHAQLFPKWATGFTNSQWGIDQKELLDIVHTYRAKHIPIDNFTLDFDWKAWGEDHYGEFRWNPVKFPDGPSGKLARELAAEGLHLTGIMKPRIHVDTVEGRYATEHHLWVPGEKVSDDYFSHKPVKDVDFDKPLTRKWFGALAMKYGFDKGIVGWWNDEADEINDDTQFLNMQRSLYTAQRAHTDIRVWSINRNFWLGSQRYAYGMWSGDIHTGFDNMAAQRERMLSAIDVGETLWGMDGGGFHGHPSDENYARWIEFGAFTPIFRVHGDHDEKRQPWRYGPTAEKAATAAIRLRYRLIPYIYSYFWQGHAHGVGLVRPLAFAWPHDARVRNDVNAWMFGDWLLVSPVMHPGQDRKQIYLPAGTWTEWSTGKVYPGGQSVTVATDSVHWSDIPLFIRQGAILPTQPVMDYVGQHPVATVDVDVFPAAKATHFDYYDDNGRTYAYEHGAYYLQRLDTQRGAHGATFRIEAAKGSYVPQLRQYLVKMHGIAAATVQGAGQHYASLDALKRGTADGWATGNDRYGSVTWVRVAAGKARTLRFAAQ